MSDDDTGDDEEGDETPSKPLLHRPQGNWLEERLAEYETWLDELSS